MAHKPFILKREKSVLLVIDMQNDFIEEDGCLKVPAAREGLSRLKRLIDVCRELKVPVIYTAHVHLPNLQINPMEVLMFPELKERGLRLGSSGAEIHSEIEPKPSEMVVYKHRYDAFYGTNLDIIIQNIKGPKVVDTLMISGVVTNICCESTARSAFLRDYRIVFGSDVTFAMDEESQKATLKTISLAFGRIMSSKEMIEALEKGEFLG
ncbi:MAG: cysteine hydrolase [Candidatus Methylarchaceae archaeon HK01B]|nr:cysteine hydrolase [Candidatus Methylarchaceae archaeon HK01B]